MEGSRHERAVIVIASYVIGFTAAFIFYASIESPTTDEVLVYLPPQSNSAAVIESQPVVEEEKIVEKQPASLSYDNGLLEVHVNNDSHLLSFNPTISGLDADSNYFSQGFHFGEINYLASGDNEFVFFCEKHDVEDPSCNGYVYEVSTNVIHPVTKDTKEVFISPKSATNAIWTEGGLQIGDSYSANKTMPWVLISKDSPLDLE